MLKITRLESPAVVEDYFCRDHRLKPREQVGHWHGTVAERLQVRDLPLTQDSLHLGLSGWVPDGPFKGSRLRRRNIRSDPGTAVVFSTGKTVSLAAAADPSVSTLVHKAFHRSACATVSAWEHFACRQGPAMETTSSLLSASFLHESSRYGDPHLHLHLLLLNTTWDRRRNRLCGLNLQTFWKGVRPMDRVFQAELVRELRANGLDSVLAKRGSVTAAEIRGVPPELVQTFSTGRRRIQAAALSSTPRLSMPAGRWANHLGNRIRPAKTPTPVQWPSLEREVVLERLPPGPRVTPDAGSVALGLQSLGTSVRPQSFHLMHRLADFAERSEGVVVAAGLLADGRWQLSPFELSFAEAHRLTPNPTGLAAPELAIRHQQQAERVRVLREEYGRTGAAAEAASDI